MSDLNPYASPKANVDAVPGEVDIDTLQVSATWKRRFRAMQKAGGPNLPDIKMLTKEERKGISMFNIVAFLFGPFYYLFKGMWRKGLTLFTLTLIGILVLDFVLELAGFGKYAKSTSFAAGAVYAVLANRDYYAKMVLGQNGWWWSSEEK
ncbi:MAG: DUF2628 domain-containing protein [Burkholderiales bacterium]